MKLRFLLSLLLPLVAVSAPIRDDLAGHHFTFPQEDAIVPIDYIESTGTQYLNLLFKKSDVPDIVIEVRFSKCPFNTSYSYFNGLLGWCEATNGNATGLKVASNGVWLRDGRNTAGDQVVAAALPVDIEAVLSSNGAIVNGVEVPTYKMSLAYSWNFPCGLFCFSSSVDCEPKGGVSSIRNRPRPLPLSPCLFGRYARTLLPTRPHRLYWLHARHHHGHSLRQPRHG